MKKHNAVPEENDYNQTWSPGRQYGTEEGGFSWVQGMTPVKPDKKLVDMVSQAIEDKQKDTLVHNLCLEDRHNEEDKQILWHIHLDEIKHKKLLENIYFMLTGSQYQPPGGKVRYDVGKPLPEQVYSEMMMDKLGSVEYFRRLYYATFDMTMRDMFFEILTDEQAHAIKLGYLWAKYK